MSTLLIKNAHIIDPGGPFHDQNADILVRKGIVESIQKGIEASDMEFVDIHGAFLSGGWTDCLAFCGEPGEEWKEDLQSLALASAAGGFTSVAAFCGNHPFPDRASAIASIVKNSHGLPTRILPMGAATKNKEGKEMAEIYDMKSAGAVAFFDGGSPIRHAGLKAMIMEYAQNCNASFIIFPHNPELALNGTVHDGPQGNAMGLKGIPSICEINEVMASIELARWLKTPLRLGRISTAESVELVRKAKADGIEIYTSVSVMNLLFTDANLEGFDENFKVMPPLRSEKDRQALVNGLMDGTIDAVCSNHNPQDSENKDVEFEYAAFGASTIQTAFQMLNTALGENANPSLIAAALFSGNRKFLGLDFNPINVGSQADFTVFNLDSKVTFNPSMNLSKSVNSPVFGCELNGNVLATMKQGEWHPNSTPLNL